MQTIKALKTTSILNAVFCFCCIISLTCLVICHYSTLEKIKDIVAIVGGIALLGWLVNPSVIISFVKCLSTFLAERKLPEAKRVIGNKWIWIFIWPTISTIFYVVSSYLLISITGGV